nr:hypothetical protein Iba_chr06dCG1740 [Ipomoea batatas]
MSILSPPKTRLRICQPQVDWISTIVEYTEKTVLEQSTLEGQPQHIPLAVGIHVHKARGQRGLPKGQQKEDKGTSQEFSRFQEIQLVWEV